MPSIFLYIIFAFYLPICFTSNLFIFLILNSFFVFLCIIFFWIVDLFDFYASLLILKIITIHVFLSLVFFSSDLSSFHLVSFHFISLLIWSHLFFSSLITLSSFSSHQVWKSFLFHTTYLSDRDRNMLEERRAISWEQIISVEDFLLDLTGSKGTYRFQQKMFPIFYHHIQIQRE